MNPLLNDDEIFYESRKIVIAEMQQITYNEFLPILLGQEISNKLNATSANGRYFTRYSSKNRPGTYNEFAVSAFPLFKGLVPPRYRESRIDIKSLVTESVQERMFEASDSSSSKWDALKIAIHKTRDHGIPSYTEFKHICDEYLDRHLIDESSKTFGLLKDVYTSPGDIDLVIGAIIEKPQNGAVFGPTLSCIFARQFEKLRNSDRFWFENDIPPSSLPLSKLKAIQDVTLAGILCSTKAVSVVQPQAFYLEDPYLNSPINCKHLYSLDLTHWEKDSMSRKDDSESTLPRIKYVEKEDTLDSDISEDILSVALNRAREKLMQRKKKEYDLWLISK